MKNLFIILFLSGAFYSCSSDKENSFNSTNEALVNSAKKTGSPATKQEYNVPLTVEQCKDSEHLSIYFNRGCVLAISELRRDISQGIYGAPNIPQSDQNISDNLSVEEYAQRLGYLTMENQMVDDLVAGFVAYDKAKKEYRK